jgi:hypothetical protein
MVSRMRVVFRAAWGTTPAHDLSGHRPLALAQAHCQTAIARAPHTNPGANNTMLNSTELQITEFQITQWLPIVAAAGFGLVTGAALFGATKPGQGRAGPGGAPAASSHAARAWLWPALLSGAFMLFSLTAVVQEGPLGFWPEHGRNLWCNQIWFDLLLALGTAWFFVLPQASSQGMRPGPWLLLIICTGSMGLLAMVARLLHLRQQDRNQARF